MKRKTLLTLVLVALLVPALLLAAGLASGLPTAAQTTVRPGTSAILAIHGSVLTLSRAKQGTMQVSTSPGTIVLKNGTFTTASALAVGDRVLLNPSPAQVAAEGGSNMNTQPGAKPSGQPPAAPVAPGGNGSTGLASGPSTNPPSHAGKDAAKPAPGAGTATPPLARLLWVPQGQEQLLRGTVRAVQGGQVVLAGSNGDVTLLVGKATVYQEIAGVVQAPQAVTLSTLQANSSVIVLGTPAGQARTFRAQAIILDAPARAPGNLQPGGSR